MTQPSRSLQLRLFLTCWLVFCLHFATDIVREHYLAFSLAEDYAFRMDKYLGLHVDIFETPGRGAHIGNNPGISMLAAIPYWAFRPVIGRVVDAVNARREVSEEPLTAIYDDPRPSRQRFFRRVRERGLDIQFGLAGGVIQLFFTAPVSAAAAVVMLRLLAGVGLPHGTALLYALLYALGTPIFFRSAFLNQNLLLAHLLLFGFLLLWRPSGWPAWRDGRASVVAGLLGGTCLLSDYSGGLVLAWLGLYAMARAHDSGGWPSARRAALRYTAGAVPPIALLLFYQWRSFGSPWYPGQHYMPPVEWIEVGYQGVGAPQLELLWMLLFDPRFGLFLTAPILILGLVGLVPTWRGRVWLPRREAGFLFGLVVAFLMFFSTVQYTRLQWVTGIRYLVPVIPCLLLLAIPVLMRMSPLLRHAILVLAFAQSWCLSMARGPSVPESIERVMLGGFQLPWLSVLKRMAPQYFPFMTDYASPLPLLMLSGALLYGVWRYPERERLG